MEKPLSMLLWRIAGNAIAASPFPTFPNLKIKHFVPLHVQAMPPYHAEEVAISSSMNFA
jgi:hypothetical protein